MTPKPNWRDVRGFQPTGKKNGMIFYGNHFSAPVFKKVVYFFSLFDIFKKI